MTDNPLLNAEVITGFLIFCGLVAGTILAISKWVDAKVTTALAPIIHKINNNAQQLLGLANGHTNHAERLVKLETLVENIDKAVERIEFKLDAALKD